MISFPILLIKRSTKLTSGHFPNLFRTTMHELHVPETEDGDGDGDTDNLLDGLLERVVHLYFARYRVLAHIAPGEIPIYPNHKSK